jgi:peptidoglycan/xylan/chitin deacetylase (PgdA/CDA1 family)
MSDVLRCSVAAAICLTSSLAQAEKLPPRPHQVVIISFDGANDIAQWQRSRTLAASTGARFTYFLSCVFLLSPENRRLYQAPNQKAGRSNVGFALSKDDVAARIGQIWQARSEGHDIASHGCGHFDGAKWGEADWRREFSSFATILRDTWRINGIAGEPSAWRHFAQNEIKGFRAPYLSTGADLDAALAASSYSYNASGVSRAPEPPAEKDGVIDFALPQIPEGPNGRRVIAMDYNIFVRHSGGFERSDQHGVFEARALAAFLAAFDKQYAGERAPLQYGFHFTLMNGGAYWRALEQFAHAVCTKPDVDCISYADYIARPQPKDGVVTSGVGG